MPGKAAALDAGSHLANGAAEIDLVPARQGKAGRIGARPEHAAGFFEPLGQKRVVDIEDAVGEIAQDDEGAGQSGGGKKLLPRQVRELLGPFAAVGVQPHIEQMQTGTADLDIAPEADAAMSEIELPQARHGKAGQEAVGPFSLNAVTRQPDQLRQAIELIGAVGGIDILKRDDFRRALANHLGGAPGIHLAVASLTASDVVRHDAKIPHNLSPAILGASGGRTALVDGRAGTNIRSPGVFFSSSSCSAPPIR